MIRNELSPKQISGIYEGRKKNIYYIYRYLYNIIYEQST